MLVLFTQELFLLKNECNLILKKKKKRMQLSMNQMGSIIFYLSL